MVLMNNKSNKILVLKKLILIQILIIIKNNKKLDHLNFLDKIKRRNFKCNKILYKKKKLIVNKKIKKNKK